MAADTPSSSPLAGDMAVPAAGPVIRVRHLTKHFEDVTAVEDLSFDIAGGVTAALLGANGAGKTTTIAMLLGLLLPTSGEITVLGEDMLRYRHRVLARINFSSPYVDLPRRLRVQEVLAVYGGLYDLPHLRARIAEVSAELQIEAFLRRPLGSLSAGQRSRVALAKGLINRPEILFLDEPTASLDPDTADWVRTYLLDYQQRTGATILLASHNMAEVERMASDVLIMQRGSMTDRGTPAELIARYGREDLEQVFLDIARSRTKNGATPAHDAPDATRRPARSGQDDETRQDLTL
jgi:ABC-2 type transport system ATP-binding protein